MKRRCIVFVWCVVFHIHPENLFSQSRHIYINPGVKIGYAFGSLEGFMWGAEVSITSYSREQNSYGVVLDIDFCKDQKKVHVGVQASKLAGISVGPSWISKKGSTDKKVDADVGFSVTFFAGAVIYPYLSFTKVGDLEFSEAGTYIKGYIYTEKGQSKDFIVQ